jgi:hypothetical protein
MPRRAAAVFVTALMLSACASPRQPGATVGEETPALVPAGVTPLTVEQEEDSAGVLPEPLPPGDRMG